MAFSSERTNQNDYKAAGRQGCFNLLQNMLQDVSLERPWDFLQDSLIALIVRYGTWVTNDTLYCIYLMFLGDL